MPISLASYAVSDCVKCPDCNGYYNPADNPGILVGDHWLANRVVCINCAKYLGYIICDGCNEAYYDNDLTDCDDRMLCDNCREVEEWYVCVGCGSCYHINDLAHGTDNDLYCDNCWRDHYFTCEDCNNTCDLDDMSGCEDRSVCNECYRYNSDYGEFDCSTFYGKSNYSDMTSKRKFGVEIETSECPNYDGVRNSGCWGAKTDGSISGKEFYSPILWGDEGLNAIRELCEFADNNGWRVDTHCGLHAHFDMRDEDTDSMKAIALAYLLTSDIWHEFVDYSRRSNRYCHSLSIGCGDLYGITDWDSFANRNTRFTWINFNAYSVHGTFEVRLHHGSLNDYEICNWIKAHAAFMDWASSAGWTEVRNALLPMNNAEKFEFIAQVWRDAGYDNLEDYYNSKSRGQFTTCNVGV